jgi:hypothetical protein
VSLFSYLLLLLLLLLLCEFQIFLYAAEFRLFSAPRQELNLLCPFLLHFRASDSKQSKRGNGGIAPCIPNFGI